MARRLGGQAQAIGSAGGTCLSVALRAAPRARGNHWPVHWPATRAGPVLARNRHSRWPTRHSVRLIPSAPAWPGCSGCSCRARSRCCAAACRRSWRCTRSSSSVCPLRHPGLGHSAPAGREGGLHHHRLRCYRAGWSRGAPARGPAGPQGDLAAGAGGGALCAGGPGERDLDDVVAAGGDVLAPVAGGDARGQVAWRWSQSMVNLSGV
jgi:hypothetical protein